MKIKRFIGGHLESNGYVIYQKQGGPAYIIDPGYSAEVFLNYLSENSLDLQGIILTHHHYDHVGGVAKISMETGCPVYLHRNDLNQYKGRVDKVMEDGDSIFLEEEELKVIHSPGHTEGGICLYSEKSKVVFTGDTLFNVDIGRTDLDDGSPDKMEKTMKTIVNAWSNEITIYPGHGDSCTMKFVRANNPEFLYALSL